MSTHETALALVRDEIEMDEMDGVYANAESLEAWRYVEQVLKLWAVLHGEPIVVNGSDATNEGTK